jgi:Fe-S cluster biogenesis protein NfuA|tara:strand:+ start:1853 stop:2101 length:249 start_codon:yes stop_codon:yes gene_type:complete
MQDHKTGDSMEEEVEEILESLRPMLIQDGGNVELVEVEDGVVKVRLVGACVSCSSSLMTLKMGIEKALKKAIPMVRCVESVE